MEGDAKVKTEVSAVQQQHIKDGVIDLAAGSLGEYYQTGPPSNCVVFNILYSCFSCYILNIFLF